MTNCTSRYCFVQDPSGNGYDSTLNQYGTIIMYSVMQPTKKEQSIKTFMQHIWYLHENLWTELTNVFYKCFNSIFFLNRYRFKTIKAICIKLIRKIYKDR